MQVIMRLYVQYTSPYYLSFIQNGKEQNSINNYSFNHVAVLENQLRYPVPGRTMLSDFYEKLSLYRLQEWKFADFDGVLKGNPLLVPKEQHSELLFV